LAKPSPTRVYIRNHRSEWARLFWVHNNKPNEMLLGVHNLDGGLGRITYEFPERQWTAGASEARIKFTWLEATAVDQEIDHFTCHADGRFHARTKTGPDFYTHVEQRAQPLGPSTSTFLDVIIASDAVSRYRVIDEKPKYPHVWVQAPEGCCLALKCLFSGVNYALEKEAVGWMAQGQHGQAGVILTSGTLKGVIRVRPVPIGQEASENRPPGTLLVFRWPRGAQTWGAKAFIVD
jgi:hypothetical protein